MNFHLEERYLNHDSPVHRMDARVKIVSAVLMIVCIVLTPDRAWFAYPLLWLVVAAMAAASRIGIVRLARLGTVSIPFALAAITLIFTTPGNAIGQLFGATITDAGLIRFVAIIVRNWLAVQVALILAMSTHFTDLLWALRSLRVPAVIVSIVGFMYRYLATIADEADRMLKARAARSANREGKRSGGSLVWRAQIAGGMVANLFLRSYERSERVYAAMLSRGFAGEWRTFAPPPLTRRDFLSGALPVVAMVSIALLARIYT